MSSFLFACSSSSINPLIQAYICLKKFTTYRLEYQKITKGYSLIRSKSLIKTNVIILKSDQCDVIIARKLEFRYCKVKGLTKIGGD